LALLKLVFNALIGIVTAGMRLVLSSTNHRSGKSVIQPNPTVFEFRLIPFISIQNLRYGQNLKRFIYSTTFILFIKITVHLAVVNK